jgi:SCP-2 sterol transfer family
MMIIKKFLSSREDKKESPAVESTSQEVQTINQEVSLEDSSPVAVEETKDSYALEADAYNNKEQFAETVIAEDLPLGSAEGGFDNEGVIPEDDEVLDEKFPIEQGNEDEPQDNFIKNQPRNGGRRQDDFEEPVQSPRDVQIKSVKEFFNIEVLYRFDILEPEEKEKIKGTYQISLNGNNGGDWFVSVGDDIKVENSKNPADVSLSMSENDFMNIINGHINPQLAILARKVLVKGDHKRAIYVNSLLAPERD